MGKWASRQQQKWAHTASGRAALTPAEIKKRDDASKGKKLPARAKRKRKGR